MQCGGVGYVIMAKSSSKEIGLRIISRKERFRGRLEKMVAFATQDVVRTGGGGESQLLLVVGQGCCWPTGGTKTTEPSSGSPVTSHRIGMEEGARAWTTHLIRGSHVSEYPTRSRTSGYQICLRMHAGRGIPIRIFLDTFQIRGLC